MTEDASSSTFFILWQNQYLQLRRITVWRHSHATAYIILVTGRQTPSLAGWSSGWNGSIQSYKANQLQFRLCMLLSSLPFQLHDLGGDRPAVGFPQVFFGQGAIRSPYLECSQRLIQRIHWFQWPYTYYPKGSAREPMSQELLSVECVASTTSADQHPELGCLHSTPLINPVPSLDKFFDVTGAEKKSVRASFRQWDFPSFKPLNTSEVAPRSIRYVTLPRALYVYGITDCQLFFVPIYGSYEASKAKALPLPYLSPFRLGGIVSYSYFKVASKSTMSPICVHCSEVG